jgi:hypothetical protein
MSAANRRTRLLVGLAAAAAMGLALVSVGVVAVGSSTASAHERSEDIAYALAAGRDGKLVVAGVSGSSSARAIHARPRLMSHSELAERWRNRVAW